MTIDEAIEHCKNIKSCDECKKEHQQIAEWLEELKAFRNNNYKDFYYNDNYIIVC